MSPQTLVYQFFVFYEMNGCSKVQTEIKKSKSSKEKYLNDFEFCPWGVHEGDWEQVDVEVCRDFSAPVTVAYSYHSWATSLACWKPIPQYQTINSTNTAVQSWRDQLPAPGTSSGSYPTANFRGECPMTITKDGFHPHSYVALDSHGNHPYPAAEVVWSQTDVAGIFQNVEFLSFIDVVGYDPNL